jgi:hypothetical protein
MPTVDFICLANSKKRQGRCVAGIKVGGGWIRPVSNTLEGILFHEYILAEGNELKLLDLVRVEVTNPRPEAHQPENWVLTNAKMTLLARPAPKYMLSVLQNYLTNDAKLLGNSGDKISESYYADNPLKASLTLVNPAEIEWNIATHNQRGTRQVRACFDLGGKEYSLSVTDPLWLAKLETLPLGNHPSSAIGLSPNAKIWLTISLSEPFNGACYKLVAAVIVNPVL